MKFHTKKHGVFLLAVLIPLFGCGQKPSSPGVVQKPDAGSDGHVRMLQILKEIKQRTTEENVYLGDGRETYLKKELLNLPHSADVGTRVNLLFLLGVDQLHNGRTEEAIARLKASLALVPKVKDLSQQDNPENVIEYQLAVAYLRQAENENCVQCCNGESCILPIRGAGVHQFKSGSNNAIQHLTTVLKRNPKDLSARWLLNIAYMTVGTYPDKVPKEYLISPESFESKAEFPRFKNVAKDLGLDEFSLCGGLVVDDLNNDGWLDVVASNYDTSGQIRCYLANSDGTFTDNTVDAGLTGLFGGLNLIQGDYDNDGDVDILVLRGAWLQESGRIPNSLLANDGKGNFRDVTFEAGLGEVHYPTQTAAWADYDNDGDLDLYIGNEKYPCQLFENDGQGRFKDVAKQAGVVDGGFVKGVVWGDYDGDRYPDLYLSILGAANRLFHNNGDGTFTDVAVKLGVEGPKQSFPAWFWDFDNDGLLDLYVAAYGGNIREFAADYLGLPHKGQTDCLYRGSGGKGFRDVSKEMNIQRVTLPMGANFGDLDNDGFLDFYLGTGNPEFDTLMPNRMFYNQRGKGFVDVSSAGGFGHLQKGHGIAFADYDHDGDQDVFIELGGAYRDDAFANTVFQNPGFGNHWISIKLVGKGSNSMGVGARIRVDVDEDGSKRSIYRWMNSGGSFGANPLRAHIGLGKADKIKELEVYWPTTDTVQRFKNVSVDQLIQIVEGQDQWDQLSAHPLGSKRIESIVSAAYS